MPSGLVLWGSTDSCMLSKHSNCAMDPVLKRILKTRVLPRYGDTGLQSQPVGDEAGGLEVQGPSGFHKTLSHKTKQTSKSKGL